MIGRENCCKNPPKGSKNFGKCKNEEVENLEKEPKIIKKKIEEVGQKKCKKGAFQYSFLQNSTETLWSFWEKAGEKESKQNEKIPFRRTQKVRISQSMAIILYKAYLPFYHVDKLYRD